MPAYSTAPPTQQVQQQQQQTWNQSYPPPTQQQQQLQSQPQPYHPQQQWKVQQQQPVQYQQQQTQSQPAPSYPPLAARPSGTALTSRNPRLSRPPFVDPQTNIIYDTSDAEYEGWLTKQSTWFKEWRRRYFILKGSKLFFAKNEYAAPHGFVDLATCTTVKSADLKARKRHSFEISTPETTYLLYADTETEKDDWIGRVGKAIVRCSRTYYQASAANSHHADPNSAAHQPSIDESDDDDIYVNDDPENPYFND
jgi:hypothetical protein